MEKRVALYALAALLPGKYGTITQTIKCFVVSITSCSFWRRDY
jgi:hypothetical protein